MCVADKAPGIRSYYGVFIKSWEALKQRYYGCFPVHDQEFVKRSFNATYIALVPKKTGAREVRDCRPNSFIGKIYKVF